MMKLGKRQEKWLKALESGRYAQNIGTLQGMALISVKDDDGEDMEVDHPTKIGHCCLGVANKVCRLGEPIDHNALDFTYQKLGLRSSGGMFDRERCFGKNKAKSLVALNDELKYDFKQIAAFIRKYPHAVFTESV